LATRAEAAVAALALWLGGCAAPAVVRRGEGTYDQSPCGGGGPPYHLTKDERLAEAAIPSLLIVAVGLLPLVFVSRRIMRAAG